VTSGSLPPGLTLSSSGVISGTPTATGTYTGTVTATNGVGAAMQNFTLAVYATAFDTWAGQYFTTQQMNDPAISGPMATPQNDGVSNLLKYLFDINPSEVMSATDRAALIAGGITTNGGVICLTLTFRENPTASGITVNVQTSPDLQNWTTLPQSQTSTPTAYTIQQIRTDATTGDPIMQVQVVAEGAREFIRLNVTSP
jgi:hypothetical protein